MWNYFRKKLPKIFDKKCLLLYQKIALSLLVFYLVKIRGPKALQCLLQ